VLGSVYVGPAVILMEKVEPYPEGVTVVPIVYSFLFLQESEWRKSSDGLFFRPPSESEPLELKSWIRGIDGQSRAESRWAADVSIRPRDGLSWSAVQTKHDISVHVGMNREP